MEIGLRMRYINLLWLHTKKGNIPAEIMEHTRARANSEDLSKSSVEDLKIITSQTREELKKIQERAKEMRERELQEKAEAYIAEGKLPMGKAYKILIEQEQIKREYSSIQLELERKKYVSLTRLIVPGEKNLDNTGNIVESPGTVYIDKDKVHELLIERNVKHFSLAEQTPQGINGFIYEALGPYGTSEFSGRVLEGKLSEEDKSGFNLIEAKELCMATSRPDP